MKVQLFSQKGRSVGGVVSPLTALVQNLQGQLNHAEGGSFASASVAGAALSMEAIDPVLNAELERTLDGLGTALEGVFNSHAEAFTVTDVDGTKKVLAVTTAQRQAGLAAAVIASNMSGFLAMPTKHNVQSMEGMTFMPANGGDYAEARLPSMEAYDERENKNAVVYSVAYNMQAARQDEFGEAFYPTVVVTPDQMGYGVSIRLVEVMNELRRSISGDVTKFGRRNIVQAVIDPSILRNDGTKITPVVRAESVNYFVAAARVAPYDVLVEGETVSTAPLKMGSKFSLLGISQTEALLDTGVMDHTDALDASVVLSKLYMTVTDADDNPIETFKFDVSQTATSTFNYAVQGGYRQMNLNFKTEGVKIGGTAIPKMVTGVNSTLLASLATLSVRLGFEVFGSVNLETAETRLQAGAVEVISITDVDGNQLPLTSGAGATAKALFDKAVLIGYDLEAQRTNSNRRQRGQLLTTNFYNQLYAVPLRAPITCTRPLTAGDANDSSDLAALITATHARTSNAAVEELLKIDQVLAAHVNNADKIGAAPDILGVARFIVQPFYEAFNLDVKAAVDSLTSSQRSADVQAVLVNKVRDMVYRMYTASGYKAAADALAGGQSQTPTIIIGTDPTIARYLMVEGDFRTIGPDFQVKIVSTLNQDMKGKIFMTFGDFTSGKDGVPNPMHFGNMAWKPELTLVLPITRNGATSKELTVMPSFRHVTNLPILARINVSGIENVIASKVAVNTDEQP